MDNLISNYLHPNWKQCQILNFYHYLLHFIDELEIDLMFDSSYFVFLYALTSPVSEISADYFYVYVNCRWLLLIFTFNFSHPFFKIFTLVCLANRIYLWTFYFLKTVPSPSSNTISRFVILIILIIFQYLRPISNYSKNY